MWNPGRGCHLTPAFRVRADPDNGVVCLFGELDIASTLELLAAVEWWQYYQSVTVDLTGLTSSTPSMVEGSSAVMPHTNSRPDLRWHTLGRQVRHQIVPVPDSVARQIGTYSGCVGHSGWGVGLPCFLADLPSGVASNVYASDGRCDVAGE